MKSLLKLFNKMFFNYESENVKILNDDSAKYFINDPSTPDLSEPQVIPEALNFLPYNVAGFNINGTDELSIEANNCYITINRSLNNFNNIISQIDKPVEKWAATKNLGVNTRAGVDYNAFYDRNGLHFFYAPNAQKRMIYTAHSSDIVAHELGHALLDSIRPDFWGTQCVEIWAFHEAFGDINAIASILENPKMVKAILDETNGDLIKSNSVSRLAEELGGAINPGRRGPAYLRDASVPFVYVNPMKLPQSAAEDRLSSECHSFSRVFTGVWYDILVEIFKQERKSMGDIEAVQHASRTAFSYLLKAVKMAPATIRFTEAVAKGMLIADGLKGEKYRSVLNYIFKSRKIIKPQIKILSATTWDDVKDKITKEDEVVNKDNILLLKKKSKKILKLSDHVVGSLSDSNPLFNVDIEVPADKFYQFDKNGNVVDEYVDSEDDLIKSSIFCVMQINNRYGYGENKMWKIENNKLKRNHMVCCCEKRY